MSSPVSPSQFGKFVYNFGLITFGVSSTAQWDWSVERAGDVDVFPCPSKASKAAHRLRKETCCFAWKAVMLYPEFGKVNRE
jgi:hypothetical protein